MVEANSIVVIPDEARRLCRDAVLRFIDQIDVEDYNADTADTADRQMEMYKIVEELLT